MGGVLSKLLFGAGESWDKIPWKTWTSPWKRYRVLPTFVVVEWMYRVMSWTCLYHAMKTNGVPLWFSAWLCGTANDVFFMFLPFVDNFWQAQACVMITPRLPLYIVEMYSVIIYLSTTAARQFNLPYVSEATLTGLLAHVLYGVYDINGPPFLWWSWHDSDAAISARQHNAPLGSSIWILTYISIHSLLLRWTEYPYARLVGDTKIFIAALLQRLPASATELVKKLHVYKWLDKLGEFQAMLNRPGGTLKWALRIMFSGFVCTPLFMSAMGAAQILSLDTVGIPGQRTYRLILAVFSAWTLRGFIKAYQTGALFLPKHESTYRANRILLAATTMFYAVNLAIGRYGDPSKHVSTGVHQNFNTESRIVNDVMGFKREDFIRSEGPKQYSKHDYQLPTDDEEGSLDASGEEIILPKNDLPNCEWYTIKGKPRRDKRGDNRLMRTFATLGMIGYTAAFANVFSLPSFLA